MKFNNCKYYFLKQREKFFFIYFMNGKKVNFGLV